MAENSVANLSTAGGVLTTESTEAGGLAGPLRGFRFTATFGDLGTASFKSISGGLGVNTDTQEYREGAFGRLTKRKLPGMLNYEEITLEKGVYSNPILYSWFMTFLEGQRMDPVPESTIEVYDNAGVVTARWYVINAWPSAYSGPTLSAEDSSILVESLTIQNEGVLRDVTLGSGA